MSKQQHEQQGDVKRKWLASLDMYRKVPTDLMEGTRQGSLVSWIALFVMSLLFWRETTEFLTPHRVTDIHLDNSKVKQVRVDFNLTMLDLRCEFATVNVVSFLGTEQNITKDITRFQIHYQDIEEGLLSTRASAESALAKNNQTSSSLMHSTINTKAGRGAAEVANENDSNSNLNSNTAVIMHDPSVTSTLEELHANGKDVVAFDQETLEFALEDHEFVFIKYFANWCGHCRALAPTWERFAEIMHDVEEKTKTHLGQDYSEREYQVAKRMHLPVLIGEVDCVDHKELCWDEEIRGYPTLVLYVNGERYKDGGEYDGDRTLASFIQFLLLAEDKTIEVASEKIKEHVEMALTKHLNMTAQHKDWLTAMDRSKTQHEAAAWDKNDHPACRLVGSLHLNRAPGHFFVQAGSKTHDLDPHMANMSHIIHHLSFHAATTTVTDNGADSVSTPDFAPNHYQHAVAPLDGHAFVVHDLHQSWHHYLKLVSITGTDRFQVLKSSQVSLYRDDHVPEAKIVLDISPIAVKWKITYRPWYRYITSLLAILGGTFTVVGMLESSVETATKKIHRATTRRPRPRPPPLASTTAMANNAAKIGHPSQRFTSAPY